MPAELSEQIKRFEEKYAENPDSLVFARLADLYRKAGDPDRGLSLLQEGLERHPDYLSAHIVRARCLVDLGRQGEAEAAFERVLERDEQNLVALRGLAEVARERGDVDEAERRYEELLDLDPHNEEARSALEDLVGGGARGAPPPGEPPGVDDGEGEADGRGGEDLDAGPAEPSEADDDAGFRPGAEPDEEGPWWTSGEPDEGEPPVEPDETGRTAPSDEPAPAGADQSDVFSLAGPDEGEPADAVPGDGDGGTAPDDGSADEPAPAGEDADARPGDEADPAAPGPTEAGRPGTPEPASREEAEFLGLDGAEEGDAGAGEDAADGGLPAEEELTERIEEIADTAGDGPTPGREGDADAEDLLSETLADLYETQGFYREAVEMYEELLEDRPEDDELRARLEAARSAMDEGGADGEPDVPEVRSGGGTGDDTSADADEPGPAGPDPGAGGGAASRDDAGGEREPPSARSHLRALLRGEAGGRSSAPEGPEPGP